MLAAAEEEPIMETAIFRGDDSPLAWGAPAPHPPWPYPPGHVR
jgi:hypothetical protein